MRRLLALVAIYGGASRTEAAQIGGVTRQTVRDWVERLNTGGPDALVARKAPGKSPLLTLDQRAALARVVEDGPTPAIDGVVRPPVALPRAASQSKRQRRWRLVDLVQWVRERFALSISRQALGCELPPMRCCKLSARPRHHAQAQGAVAAFQKISPASWRSLPARTACALPTSRSGSATRPRVGQKNRITRRWAPQGTRPSTPRQFMRDNWLSNRVFTSCTDIVDYCCYAWNKLAEQPWTTMFIGLRDWAYGF